MSNFPYLKLTERKGEFADKYIGKDQIEIIIKPNHYYSGHYKSPGQYNTTICITINS